ncbi:MAG TPA: phenylalanine--tRNA ligase subunit beta [Candidatus Dormibacteraeota bacterium]|nr:phenylalanine--tRNA ligase subunit beta [Candidatus Dormibacteraeota bacterium]
MRISYEWLGDYVDTSGLSPHEAAHLLTMSGTKIESVQVTDLSAIIVGRVLEQKDHPRSNKPLWIHQVDVGGGKVIQIIAGAPNAKAGTLVPVALPGVTVPSGKLVRDGKIAGEAAQGMLCSADELLLGEDPEPRIMLLDRGEPGEPLSKYIPSEAILEAEITPNRPDCLSHMGVARELAAAAGREFKADFMPPYIEGVPPPAAELVDVAIEVPDLCSRFVAVPITGVKVGPSPEWVQRRLRAAGVRPISNVVDATAYVMLEHGKPTHVFDAAKLAGRQLHVRQAREGESILCLDGQTRKLRPGMLVVADANGPVAIGGIIGGEESKVTDSTTDVIIESAGWDGVNIRATSRALTLRTEASIRHEKGLAPEVAMAGARRAAALVREWAGGQVHADWVDVYPNPQQPVRIEVEPAKVNAILGVDVAPDEAQTALRRLGFQVRAENGVWDALPPVFRLDVELPEDVAEEVGRIYGIERIPATLPGRRRSRWTPADAENHDWDIREVLLGAGFEEVVTPALVSRRTLERIGLAEGARSVINPMSDELDTMRTSLLPSLLQVARFNQNRTGEHVDVFELARVYAGLRADGLADEPVRLTVLARTGGEPDAGRTAFLRLKAVMDRIAGDLGAAAPAYDRAQPPLYHPGRTASVTLDGRRVGMVGELHPTTLAAFDLDGRAAVLDLDVAELVASATDRKARELPRYPAVDRDLAAVVDDTVAAGELESTIRQAAGAMLEQVRAFDEYRGGQLPPGRKSVAFALTFRSPDRTLTDAEVDGAMTNISKAIAREHRAELRS